LRPDRRLTTGGNDPEAIATVYGSLRAAGFDDERAMTLADRIFSDLHGSGLRIVPRELVDALRRIAGTDYRGNEPTERAIARRTLSPDGPD
jgi:hypothetical protein